MKLSDKDLAAAVELNQAHWLRIEALMPWVHFRDDGDSLRVFAGDTWPRNRVALARFNSASVQQRVSEILAPHLKAKVACTWIVGPLSEPPDLEQHLRAQGFHCMIRCAGMARELKSLPPAPPEPPGVQIEPMDEPALLQPLTTERRRQRHHALTVAARLKPPEVWHFIARHKNRHVGGTTLLCAAGVAGIYGVEVLKEYRRRGIGAALMHTALRHAKQLGFSASVLSASGMGEQLYAKLGFREVCRLAFWKYGKMRQLTD